VLNYILLIYIYTVYIIIFLGVTIFLNIFSQVLIDLAFGTMHSSRLPAAEHKRTNAAPAAMSVLKPTSRSGPVAVAFGISFSHLQNDIK
jgi:hypothetical protein